jgi:RHS repeat-associated protein
LQYINYGPGNRIATLNGRSFVYDRRGRLVSDGIRTYQWNDRSQLLATTGPEGVVAYRYDGLGRRVTRSQGGVTTRFHYDFLNVARFESGATVTDVLLGAGVDEILAARRNEQVLAYVRDHLNSVIALATAAGGLSSFSYDEFGTPSGTSPATDAVFFFTGRERDANELVYLRARYYVSESGRFLSEDPIGLAGELVNSYRYVGNDPINLVDPTGLRVAARPPVRQPFLPPRPPTRPTYQPTATLLGRYWGPAYQQRHEFLENYADLVERAGSEAEFRRKWLEYQKKAQADLNRSIEEAIQLQRARESCPVNVPPLPWLRQGTGNEIPLEEAQRRWNAVFGR